jgi:hypothetical protein
MSAIAKLFEKYSPKAIAFLERVAKKYFDNLNIDASPEEIEKRMTEYDSWIGHRIENIDRDFPEAFDQYDTSALIKAIEETEISGKSALAMMDPKNFEKLAQPIPDEFMDYGHGIPMPENPEVRTSREKVKYLTEAFSEGQPVKNMPQYWFQTVKQPEQLDYLNRPFEYFQVAGHEGRHRNRALVGAGKDKSLVKVYHPKYESPKDNPDALVRSERPYDGEEGAPAQILPGTVSDYLKFLGFGGLAALPATQQDFPISP